MSQEIAKWPYLEGTLTKSLIENVISDLRKANDIEGAALVEGDSFLIAYDLPGKSNYITEIPEIMTQVNDMSNLSPAKQMNQLFSHCIFDYNGSKVLAKKLKGNLTLLVLLQKRGYIGLAMLDIENSIRRIDEIIMNVMSNALT